MDLLRRFLLQVRAQLAALNTSQKLVIALLGVIVVATICATVVWSAKPQMVPLIAQPMSAEDIANVEMELKGKHSYQVSGNQILVPVDQAYSIRGELAAAVKLPRNLSDSFSRVLDNAKIFNSDAQNKREYNNAMQQELTRWLQYFPYVEEGKVIITMGQAQMLGTPAVPSTASVYVKTRNSVDLTTNQALAIVEWVSGAVPGMRRQDVHLIGNGGRAYTVPNDSTPLPSNLLEYKKNQEDYYVSQLARIFSTYGDVKMAVNVVLDMSSRVREDSTPTTSVSKPLMETTSENATSDGGPGGQPGSSSNVSATVGENTGGASMSRNGGTTSSNTSQQNVVKIGESHTHVETPPGVEIRELTASLSLPRSYFLAVYRRNNPPADPKADVKDADLLPTIKTELVKATGLAKNAIGVKADEQIRVDWYDDTILFNSPVLALGTGGTSAANGWVALVTQNINKAVLFALAAGVLGMMLMMVRRAVPAGADAEMSTAVFFGGGGGGSGKGGKSKRRGGGAVEQFDSQDDVFGEANSGEAVLTGIELDDETLQSRKMVDEVSTMIKENPENAASLVKRWMTKGK